jgi:hypothetical protein
MKGTMDPYTVLRLSGWSKRIINERLGGPEAVGGIGLRTASIYCIHLNYLFTACHRKNAATRFCFGKLLDLKRMICGEACWTPHLTKGFYQRWLPPADREVK